MILLDDRIGSRELLRHMPRGSAELCRLDFGDAALVGNGPDGNPITVGVERKAIRDLVSSMCRGRISGHQLPGLLGNYDKVYLIVEGTWRPSPGNGLLEVWGGRGWIPLRFGTRTFMAREVYNFLNTLEIISGVVVRNTRNLDETAQVIMSLSYWWAKRWDDHTSHIDVHKGAAAMLATGLHLRRPSLLCRVASELPGIGPKRARDVAQHFTSILDLCMAGVDRWEAIDGIGPKTAEAVVSAISSSKE